MIYFLYDLLLFCLTPFLLAYHLYRSVSRGRPAALAERFGFLPPGKLAPITGRDTIWVHAVSVGETIAVTPLLKALKKRYPEKKIVLSSMTETGRSIAEKMKEADLCIYFPFDYAFAADRLLQLVKPELVVIVETEIWPNFIRIAARRGIPLVMANGRISDRSFRRYLKLKPIFTAILARVSSFCMQTREDAGRIEAIGAPADRVHVAGNLKYDIPVTILDSGAKAAVRGEMLIPAAVPVFTAGSTHAGEEELVVAAYRRLVEQGRELFLVLVPRHPERAPQVVELLRREGIPHTLRSQLAGRTVPFARGEVLLVDRVGELMKYYSFSDVVFVGGSLVPTGGHNVLEPISFGVPVLFGPHMNNFREISTLLLECNGAVRVDGEDALAARLAELLDYPIRREALAGNGARLLEQNGGATERHLAVMARLLEEQSLPAPEEG